MSSATFSHDDELFRKFAFYATVLLLKTMLMSVWTVRWRRTKKFSNAESYKLFGANDKSAVLTTNDPDVERVRRCHQNDLENILPFVLIGLLFVLVEPEYHYAVLLFRVFTAARLLHTLVYLNSVRQPARVLCFLVGIVVIALMTYEVISKTYIYM